MKEIAAIVPGLQRRFSFLSSAGLLAAVFVFGLASLTRASSHSDAPLSKLDPQTNLTDVYAFIRTRPNNEKVLVVEVSVRPYMEPSDGVMYDAFSPDTLYSIHIANPTNGQEAQRYDFRFSPVGADGGNYKNLDTILRYGRGTAIGAIQTVGDAQQNFVQTYNVTQSVGGKRSTRLNDKPLLVPPANVGPRTTPFYNDANGKAISGATSRDTLDAYTKQTTYDLAGGATVFAGSREDGFYADTGGIFDLLNGRILDNNGTLADGYGQDGGGPDSFKGFNVLHYAIVIPVSQLPQFKYTGALQSPATGVGVYATVSRLAMNVRSGGDDDRERNGKSEDEKFVQVSRLANPLFNEVLVALRDKDNYNRTLPTQDASLFDKYALNPEIPVLINAVFGTNFQTTNRVDLKAVYIPDVIRVNTSTGAVPVAGEPGFNRLSFIGGDTTNGVPSGWPNGRRLGDDVVDIALTAIASGPSFSTITVVGDNVNANDQLYNRTFPYAGTPNSGTNNRKDPQR